jgi:hypothetical protein
MDVHIGEITADVDATATNTIDDARLESIARRVMALIERRERAEAGFRRDCAIEPAGTGDIERYG